MHKLVYEKNLLTPSSKWGRQENAQPSQLLVLSLPSYTIVDKPRNFISHPSLQIIYSLLLNQYSIYK